MGFIITLMVSLNSFFRWIVLGSLWKNQERSARFVNPCTEGATNNLDYLVLSLKTVSREKCKICYHPCTEGATNNLDYLVLIFENCFR